MYFPKNSYDYQSNIDHLAEPEFGRTKKIHVWEYGDSYNKDYELYINPNSLRTWNSVLKYLTDVINPTFGAVRKLVSLVSRRAIGCFAELEHNGKYVAIGAVTRIKVHQPDNYKTVSELDLIAKSKKVKKLYSGEIGPPEFKHLLEATERRLTITFILVNGRPCQTPTKLVLTKKDLRSWDVILEYLSKVMDVPDGIQYICTIFGETLFTPDQLQHGYVYVAVPFNEKFMKMDYAHIFSKKKGYTLKIRPASSKGKVVKYADMQEPDGKSEEDDLEWEDVLTNGLDSKEGKVNMARSISDANAGKNFRLSKIPPDIQSTINYLPHHQLQDEDKVNYPKVKENIEKGIKDFLARGSKTGSHSGSSVHDDADKILRNSKGSLNKLLQSIDKGLDQAAKNGYFETIKEDVLDTVDSATTADAFYKTRSGSKGSSGSLNLGNKTAENVDRTSTGTFEIIKQQLIRCLENEIFASDLAKRRSQTGRSHEDIKLVDKTDKLPSRSSVQKKSSANLNGTGYIGIIEEKPTHSSKDSISAKSGVKIQASQEGKRSNCSSRSILKKKNIENPISTGEDTSAALQITQTDTSPCEALNEEQTNLDLEETNGATSKHDIDEKAIQTEGYIPVITNLEASANEIKTNETKHADEPEKRSASVAKAAKRRTIETDSKNNVKKPFTKLNGMKKEGGITAALSENNLCSKNKHVPSIHIRNRTDINFCGFSKSKKGIICQDSKNNTYRKLYLNKSFSSPDRTSSSSESDVIRVNKGNKCCFCIHRNKSNKMNKIWEDEERCPKSTKTDSTDADIIVDLVENDTGETTEDACKETDVSPNNSVISIDSIEAEGSKKDALKQSQDDEANEELDADDEISCEYSCISLDSIDGEKPE